MVIDSIENAEQYFGLGHGIERALRFLRQDLRALPDGRADISGDKVFALIQQYSTKAREAGFWEAHRKYIDVQYMVSGTELIGYAPIKAMQEQEYDPQRDLAKLTGQGNYIELTAGSFMILFPHDVHMPGIMQQQSTHVKKIVVKTAV